jgi:LysR family transcriptional regulator (chromosome initiation inhibitor)
MRYRAMATPDFVARRLSHGPIRQVLADAPVVVFDRRDELQDRFLRKVAPRRTPGPARHCVPDSGTYLEAVAAGLGWGMIPEVQLAARRGGGEPLDLVELEPALPIDVPLHWQQWKLDSAALSEVAEAVAHEAARAL